MSDRLSQTFREDDALFLKKAEQRFKLATCDYAQLAAFRHSLRAFLRFSEEAAAHAGLTSQHYQAMLILRGWPDDRPASIGDLAQQLLIKHNSAVGLVDRLSSTGLVTRRPCVLDRRRVELRLSTQGRRVLAGLARVHRDELRRIGPVMASLLAQLTHEPEGGGGQA